MRKNRLSIIALSVLLILSGCIFKSGIKIDRDSVKINLVKYDGEWAYLTFHARLTGEVTPAERLFWSRDDGRFHRDANETDGIFIVYEVLNPFGEVDLKTKTEKPGTTNTATLPLPVFWTEENPYEYTLRITFYLNSRVQDRYSVRFRLNEPLPQYSQTSASQYWEDMTEELKMAVLHSPDVAQIVRDYVSSPWEISDDDKSFSFMDALSSGSPNRQVQALYFYQFNQILAKADGAVAEVMPEYVNTWIEKDPQFVFEYLQSREEWRKRYVFYLAANFYYNVDADIVAREQKAKAYCPTDMAAWISSFYAEVNEQRESFS